MKKDRKQTVLHIEPKKVQIHAGYDDIVQTKLTARVWYHDCNAKKNVYGVKDMSSKYFGVNTV